MENPKKKLIGANMYFPQSKKPSSAIEKAEDSITGKCMSHIEHIVLHTSS
jgi:hypothetical protein